jgi:hypothetical protein
MGLRESISKKDCFAYKNENIQRGCLALKKLYCKCEKCAFYKKKEEEK